MKLACEHNNSEETLQKSPNSNELSREHNNEQRFLCGPISMTTLTPCISDISQILPSLYLCGATCISNKIVQQLSITLIINAAAELPNMPLSLNNNPVYLHINVLDRCDVNLYEYFDQVADLIEANKQQHHLSSQNNNNNNNDNNDYGKTLIHCVAGVSRSVTLCLAYLMKYAGMTLRDAYHHIKRLRSQIRPNTGFFQQLIKYEEHLLHRKSVQMIYYECLQREIPDVYAIDYQAMEEYYQQQQQRKQHRKQQKQNTQRTILR